MAKSKAFPVSFNQLIVDRRYTAAEARKATARLMEHKVAIQKGMALAVALIKVWSKFSSTPISTYAREYIRTWSTNHELDIFCNVYGVTNLKTGMMPRMVYAAGIRGWSQRGSEDHASEHGANRTMRFERTVGDFKVTMHITAHLAEDNQVGCRKVQVGVKQVEQAVYAIVCD